MNADPNGNFVWWVTAALWGAASSLVDYYLTHSLPMSKWNKKDLAWSMARGAVIGIGLGGAAKFLLPAMNSFISFMFSYFKYSTKINIVNVINIGKKKGLQIALYTMLKRFK